MNQITPANGQPSHALTVAEPDTLLVAIIQMARDPEVDVDKFERLVAIQERRQERQDARHAETAFDVAMNAVQIENEARVPQRRKQGNPPGRYATLEAIDAVARPV